MKNILPDWFIEMNQKITQTIKNAFLPKGMTQDKLNSMLMGAGIPISRIPQNLAQQMTMYGIILEGDAKRFLANSLHETRGFRDFSENGNYTTTERLKLVFPSAFGKKGKYDPKDYLRNEKKLFDLVYDDRLFPSKALGNTKDGQGSKYKGRGLKQTTGYYNYKRLSEGVGVDFVNNPELLETDEYKGISAVFFWKDKKLSQKSTLLETRQVVVGNYSSSPMGYFGDGGVLEWYNKLK